MAIQHVENGVALRPGHAADVRGEIGIDIQRAAPGDRVGAHHRMLRARVVAVFGASLAHAVDPLAVVHGRKTVDHAAHRFGQRFVGAIHVGKQRIAAAVLGHPVHVEDGAHRRLGIAGHVGMPDLAGDVFGILVGCDLDDFRMLLHPDHRMHVQGAEVAAEGLVLVGGEFLFTEEDHQVLRQRMRDLVHLLRGKRLRHIDAGEFRADGRRQWFDPNGFVLDGLQFHRRLHSLFRPRVARRPVHDSAITPPECRARRETET